MTCVMCQRPWISYFLPMIPTFFFSRNDPNQPAMENVNNELKKLSNWFQAKLSIYIKNHILLYLKQQQQQQQKIGKNLTCSFQLMILRLIV